MVVVLPFSPMLQLPAYRGRLPTGCIYTFCIVPWPMLRNSSALCHRGGSYLARITRDLYSLLFEFTNVLVRLVLFCLWLIGLTNVAAWRSLACHVFAFLKVCENCSMNQINGTNKLSSDDNNIDLKLTGGGVTPCGTVP